MKEPDLIFGVGNEQRGDDAWGPWLARRLAGEVSVPVVEVGEVPEAYLHRVPPRGCLLILDAVDFGGQPGEVRLFQPLEVPPISGWSTHRLPLRVLAEYLWKAKGAQTWVLGVQPACLEWGAPLSPAVKAAGERILPWLLEWLAGNGAGPRLAPPLRGG